MKKINKTLIKGLALTLGVCSLIPLTACNNNDGGNKSQIWNAEKAYVQAQEQGFTGTYQEFLQSMANIRNIEINANGELVFTLGDGSVFNAGGVKGPAGNGIKSVTTEHDDENKKTIIKITFNDDTFTTVDVPDGEQGVQGEKGDKGGDGEKGDKGDTGVGIANIATTEKDRWGIVHKITYTMTDGVTYTFDIGSGVAYGRTYDANNFDEFDYLVKHNVTNIVLTNDVTCPDGGCNFYPINQQDTYYSIDLNGHSFYGVMQMDATADDCSDLPYGIYMDIRNGKIDSVNGVKPLVMETLSILGSNMHFNLNNLELVGCSSTISTNGDYDGVDIIAQNCKFSTVDTKEGEAGPAAYLPAGGQYDFTNCWFVGDVGINIKSGSLMLENCHIEGTGDYVAPVYNSSASVGSGSAFVVSSSYTYTPNLNIVIKGCELVSTHGYGLEEVSLAPAEQQAGYVATITVDKNTRFEGGKGEYVSQNNVITIKDVIEDPTKPIESSTVVLKQTPNNEELIAYATQGKKLLVVQGEEKEYKIALCNAADISSINMEETMANVNRVVVYTVVESNANIVKSIEVAHSVEEIQALVKAETQTFVAVGVQLNQIPASIFDSNYYIKKGMEYTTSTECFTFTKTNVVAVSMNSASVTYKGQTMYVALTNTTEGIANIQIDTELEGLSIEKMVLTEQDGYIASITEETFATGATMSAGETAVLRISLSGEFTTEKPISFVFSNSLM